MSNFCIFLLINESFHSFSKKKLMEKQFPKINKKNLNTLSINNSMRKQSSNKKLNYLQKSKLKKNTHSHIHINNLKESYQVISK